MNGAALYILVYIINNDDYGWALYQKVIVRCDHKWTRLAQKVGEPRSICFSHCICLARPSPLSMNPALEWLE